MAFSEYDGAWALWITASGVPVEGGIESQCTLSSLHALYLMMARAKLSQWLLFYSQWFMLFYVQIYIFLKINLFEIEINIINVYTVTFFNLMHPC